MADVTLVANSDYSALSVNDGDRILLSGYKLTLDVNPSEINVEVTAAGNAGTVALGAPNSYTLSGWTFQAGTAALIAVITGAKTFGGSVVAGSANGTYGVNSNYGIIAGSVTGGYAAGADGCRYNYGTITGDVTAGSTWAMGCYQSTGMITGAVTGGTGASAFGCRYNYGNLTGSVVGGSAAGANAIQYHYGSIATLDGIFTDDVANAFAFVGSGLSGTVVPFLLCTGANLRCVVPAGFATIYHVGDISDDATINGSPDLVEMSLGSGGSAISTGAIQQQWVR